MHDRLKNIPVMKLCFFIAALLLLVGTAGAAAAPAAAFTSTPALGTVPLTVNFTDTSTGSPAGWAWFFGDETYTQPWTEQTASSRWSERIGHSSVAMPDGSIVLMAGRDDNGRMKNDTWRSTDNGKTWMLLNASSGWPARCGPLSFALPDRSIVLMGSWDGTRTLNDTWRSIDYGETWTEMNTSSGWSDRKGHSSVALPDGTIVLMGGREASNSKTGISRNDTWKSTDYGTTWTLVNASSGWTARAYHTSVAMPDGSIVLMGGWDGMVFENSTYKNDTWRSTDGGATWTLVNASSEWSKRVDHSSVAMPDGSVVLMGGWDDNGTHRNDTWRFQPAGSSLQNPSHTYTAVGTYPVILQAFNADGYSSSQKIGYITVTSPTTTARPSGPPPLMDALLVIAAIAVSGAAGFIRRR